MRLTARRSVMWANLAVNGVIYVMGGYDNWNFLSTVEKRAMIPQPEGRRQNRPGPHPESDGWAAVIGTTILVTEP